MGENHRQQAESRLGLCENGNLFRAFDETPFDAAETRPERTADATERAVTDGDDDSISDRDEAVTETIELIEPDLEVEVIDRARLDRGARGHRDDDSQHAA